MKLFGINAVRVLLFALFASLTKVERSMQGMQHSE